MIYRVKLGKWFLYEKGIRLRIGRRQWWLGHDPPWEERF